jgi:hypothetical protein
LTLDGTTSTEEVFDFCTFSLVFFNLFLDINNVGLLFLNFSFIGFPLLFILYFSISIFVFPAFSLVFTKPLIVRFFLDPSVPTQVIALPFLYKYI